MDVGIVITGAAATAVFAHRQKDLLGHMLFLSWVAVAVETLAGVSMAATVFTAAVLDISIAGMALVIATHDPLQYKARIVGGVSMALMPMHWVMSATQGAASWTAYAIACNACFVFQCLVVGGWLDGLGGRIGSFVDRMRSVGSVRRRGG